MNEIKTTSGENKSWYVMRVTYQRELTARDILNEMGVTTFIPMITVRMTGRDGKLKKCHVAAIHNYIFINSTKSVIDDIKQCKIPWLRYVMYRNNSVNKEIMIVPDKQMQHFIAVAGNEKEKTTFISPDAVNLTKGDRVRILSGPFEGVEGVFMKVNNKRGKCVVVKINGIAAVATANIPSILVEKLD